MGTKHTAGFTLMELLIVIAIIGILVTIAMASYITAQKKTRDTRRINDLKSVQNAFEQYYADFQNNYPAGCALPTTYLPVGFPKDPRTAVSYSGTCTSSGYCVCATQEVASDGNSTDASCNFGSGGFYCVKQLQ